MRTLVIGDVHGHFDRISLLLEREGIIDPNGNRIRNDCKVIQLGDLGHFGKDGSPTGDMLCYEYADEWFDGICWGNHDRPTIDGGSVFAGYVPPVRATENYIRTLMSKNKIRMAWAANGYVLTHAGLHTHFTSRAASPADRIPRDIRMNPRKVARWVNENRTYWHYISTIRGGKHPFGGPLWRDACESLNNYFPQVFGHSARDKVRKYHKAAGTSYCVDIGSSTNGRLAGIWLPEQKVVEVKV
jgi:hypothetical protein